MLPELTGSLEQIVRFIGRITLQAMHDPGQRPLAIRRLVRKKIFPRSRKQPCLRGWLTDLMREKQRDQQAACRYERLGDRAMQANARLAALNH